MTTESVGTLAQGDAASRPRLPLPSAVDAFVATVLLGTYAMLPYWALRPAYEPEEARGLTVGIVLLDVAIMFALGLVIRHAALRPRASLAGAAVAMLASTGVLLQGIYAAALLGRSVLPEGFADPLSQAVSFRECIAASMIGASWVLIGLFERRAPRGAGAVGAHDGSFGSVRRLAALALLLLWPLVHYAKQNASALPWSGWISVTAGTASVVFVAASAMTFAARRRIVPSWVAPAMMGAALGHLLSPALLQATAQQGTAGLGLALGAVGLMAWGALRTYRLPLRTLMGFAVILVAAAALSPAGRPARHKPSDETGVAATPASAHVAVPAQAGAGLPNIYFLVYDAYPSREISTDQGFENPQFETLRARGFEVYDRVYSTGASTLTSIGRTLDWTADTPAPINGENAVAEGLRTLGYTSHLVLTPYFFGAERHAYDYVFPQANMLPTVLRSLVAREFRASFVFSAFNDSARIAEKRQILSRRASAPAFLYSHSPLPGHSQNSGRCLPDERDQYIARVQLANAEMDADLAAIERSDRTAIIVLAADHGPHLTGDCYYLNDRAAKDLTARDLRDRYSVFLAIRWPADHPTKRDSIALLQGVFARVFSALGGHPSGTAVVPSRSASAAWGTIPDSSIVGGMIRVGVDSGKPLFLAPR